jgi:Bacterial archaeo-eukaryotic release factor family 11
VHIDIPTRKDVERLMSVRRPGCVSIYLPTSPVPAEAAAARIDLKNLSGEAIAQLGETGMDRHAVKDIAEALEAVADDEDFWARQGRSLALFATQAGARTFRLPNRLTRMTEVSDRFHVKPLLRTMTFPQAAFVLALSQNGARLVEVTPDDAPVEVRVPEMPADRRIQGSEGKKVRLHQYAQRVERALRPVLSGLDLPLILATTEPLDAIFRAANTYPHLAEPGIPGSPDELTNAELSEASRTVLDELYAQELADLRAVYAERVPQGRASDDLAEVARAATFGAVQAVFLDIDTTIPGLVDEESGALTLDDADDAANYGVADEIARRVLLTGGRVLAVRSDDVPGSGSVAAILRYAV